MLLFSFSVKINSIAIIDFGPGTESFLGRGEGELRSGSRALNFTFNGRPQTIFIIQIYVFLFENKNRLGVKV